MKKKKRPKKSKIRDENENQPKRSQTQNHLSPTRNEDYIFFSQKPTTNVQHI